MRRSDVPREAYGRAVSEPNANALLRRMGELVAVEAELRRMHESMRRSPREPLLRSLRAALRHAGQPPFVPGELWLLCTARLLGEFQEPDAIDGLIDILGAPSPDARVEAGEQLQGLAETSLDVVAAGCTRALERLPADHAALIELPYVLAEIMQPPVVGMLEHWLRHPNADVVAAAIEALASLGDPSARPALAALSNDSRVSTVDHGDDELLEATLGELAGEAIALLDVVEQAQRGTSEP